MQGGPTQHVNLPTQEARPSYDLHQVDRVSSVTTDNAVFVSCCVNGLRLEALVDTGASITFIHKGVFDRVRSQDTKVCRPVRHILGANNSPLKMCGTAEVKIEMAGITATHEVYICKDLGQNMLIGVDFLKPHGCVIDVVRGTVESKGKESALICKRNWGVCRVAVADSVVIPHAP